MQTIKKHLTKNNNIPIPDKLFINEKDIKTEIAIANALKLTFNKHKIQKFITPIREEVNRRINRLKNINKQNKCYSSLYFYMLMSCDIKKKKLIL